MICWLCKQVFTPQADKSLFFTGQMSAVLPENRILFFQLFYFLFKEKYLGII